MVTNPFLRQGPISLDGIAPSPNPNLQPAPKNVAPYRSTHPQGGGGGGACPNGYVCFEDGSMIPEAEYFPMGEVLGNARRVAPQPTGRPASMPGAGPAFAQMLASLQQGGRGWVVPTNNQGQAIPQEMAALYPPTGAGPSGMIGQPGGGATGRPSVQALPPREMAAPWALPRGRPGYAPGSPTRQASMGAPDPARPDTHIVRRYQNNQPTGDEGVIAPRPDYLLDESGDLNMVVLDPRLPGYVPYNQIDVDNPSNSHYGRNVQIYDPHPMAHNANNPGFSYPIPDQWFFDRYGMTYAEWLRRRNRYQPVS